MKRRKKRGKRRKRKRWGRKMWRMRKKGGEEEGGRRRGRRGRGQRGGELSKTVFFPGEKGILVPGLSIFFSRVLETMLSE